MVFKHHGRAAKALCEMKRRCLGRTQLQHVLAAVLSGLQKMVSSPL